MKRRTLLKYAATLPILGLWPWRLASSHSPASARAGQLRAAGTLSCDTQPGGLAFPLSFPLVFQAACVAEPDAPTWTPPATATQAATATGCAIVYKNKPTTNQQLYAWFAVGAE